MLLRLVLHQQNFSLHRIVSLALLVGDQPTLTLDFMLDCYLDLCLSVHCEQRNAGCCSFVNVSFEALLAFSVGSFVLTEGPPVVQASPEFMIFLPQPPECVMAGVCQHSALLVKLYVKSDALLVLCSSVALELPLLVLSCILFKLVPHF